MVVFVRVATENMEYIIRNLYILSELNYYGFNYKVIVYEHDNIIVCTFKKLSTGEMIDYAFTSAIVESVKFLDDFIESIMTTVKEAFREV